MSPGIFVYTQKHAVRELPNGWAIWNDRIVTAISKRPLSPVEAIRFFQAVTDLLPDDWAEDPEITELEDGRIAIHGCAD
jgi:hypothetical protein